MTLQTYWLVLPSIGTVVGLAVYLALSGFPLAGPDKQRRHHGAGE